MSDHVLPTTSQERKDVPITRGVLDYFPAALAEVAKLSRAGNEKHNPGEEMHHARGKSSDHADCIVRHLLERGTIDDEDGLLHDVKVAWRALALLQETLESLGAPVARGARLAEDAAQLCPNYAGDRIAGDDEGTLSRELKNEYYHGKDDPEAKANLARDAAYLDAGRRPPSVLIYGYCAWCHKELREIGSFTSYDGVLFCSATHANNQREWNMGRKIGP